MCGIAGIIHRDATGNVGQEMTAMLQSLKHRGPDSTGYAIYGTPGRDEYVMRFKVAELEDMTKGFDIHSEVKKRRAMVDERLASLGAAIIESEDATEYAYRYRIQYDGDMKKLVDYVEDVAGTEILSMGNALELIKDLGDASCVADLYGLRPFRGTHGIGHTRMATESDVDIRSAHPYWAYPYNDIAVVHNGQLTNYWVKRREFERKGHRFVSNCDSELLAVYTAYNLEQGATLEESLKQSIEEIDGVFTYLVSTKPMVLFESDDLVALASEEVAIRTVVSREIDTRDPYDDEVLVWRV
jgi:glutamate synthase domain-containing protein 1